MPAAGTVSTWISARTTAGASRTGRPPVSTTARPNTALPNVRPASTVHNAR